MRTITYTISLGTLHGSKVTYTSSTHPKTSYPVVDNSDGNGADHSRMIQRHFDGLRSIMGWVDAGALGPREDGALLQIVDLVNGANWPVSSEVEQPHPR